MFVNILFAYNLTETYAQIISIFLDIFFGQLSKYLKHFFSKKKVTAGKFSNFCLDKKMINVYLGKTIRLCPYQRSFTTNGFYYIINLLFHIQMHAKKNLTDLHWCGRSLIEKERDGGEGGRVGRFICISLSKIEPEDFNERFILENSSLILEYHANMFE